MTGSSGRYEGTVKVDQTREHKLTKPVGKSVSYDTFHWTRYCLSIHD